MEELQIKSRWIDLPVNVMELGINDRFLQLIPFPNKAIIFRDLHELSGMTNKMVHFHINKLLRLGRIKGFIHRKTKIKYYQRVK